jgi:O-antigen/teichoic acid export membrane protein
MNRINAQTMPFSLILFCFYILFFLAIFPLFFVNPGIHNDKKDLRTKVVWICSSLYLFLRQSVVNTISRDSDFGCEVDPLISVLHTSP